MSSLAESAEHEWAALVTTAVLGTNRRRLPAAELGWQPLVPSPDPATELLNRAAAVVTARRAGVTASRTPLLIPAAPVDQRPMCSPAATRLLEGMLRGEHAVLLPEWFALCELVGVQVPTHLIPALLLRGRRDAAFDAMCRPSIGARAAWLAEAMPELGIRPVVPQTTPVESSAAPIADGGEVVTSIVSAFYERGATWAAAPQLRIAVTMLPAQWLPSLIVELSRLPFAALTERTRIDLLGLARARAELLAALTPAGTRVRLEP